MPNKLSQLFGSRKFVATIAGLITVGISYQFGHASLEATELGVLGILSAYILGVAHEDNGYAQSKAAPSTTTVNVMPSPAAPSAVVAPSAVTGAFLPPLAAPEGGLP